jgi:hypothetical protein
VPQARPLESSSAAVISRKRNRARKLSKCGQSESEWLPTLKYPAPQKRFAVFFFFIVFWIDNRVCSLDENKCDSILSTQSRDLRSFFHRVQSQRGYPRGVHAYRITAPTMIQKMIAGGSA